MGNIGGWPGAKIYLELEKGWSIVDDRDSDTVFFLVHCNQAQLTGVPNIRCSHCGSTPTPEATGFLKLCRWR